MVSLYLTLCVSQLWCAAHWQPDSTLHCCAISHSRVFPQHCNNSKVWQLWYPVYSQRMCESAPPWHKPDLNVLHIETPSRHASLLIERFSFQSRLWTPARLTSSSVTMAGASRVAGSVTMTMIVGTWAMRTNGISVVSEGRFFADSGKSGLIFFLWLECPTDKEIARYFLLCDIIAHMYVQDDLVFTFTHTGLGKFCLLLATKYHCFFQIIDLDHILSLLDLSSFYYS